MNTEKTIAFVLHRRPWKEYHQIVWLLTLSHGLIPTITYGIAHFGSRRSSHLDLLNLCEIEIEKRKNIWSIRHANAIETSFKIKENLFSSAVALSIASVLSKTLPIEMPQPKIFALLQQTLYALAQKPLKAKEEARSFYRLFEQRILELLGYTSRGMHVRPDHIRDELERSEESLELFI